MKSVYFVFSYYRSPMYITQPQAVAAFATAKEAKAFVEAKNERAVRNEYGYARIPFGVPINKQG